MTSNLDPSEIFDSDEIDNAIQLIENEIAVEEKKEIVNKINELPEEKKNTIDNLVNKALEYVENVNSQADDLYTLFYGNLATNRDRTDASKVAVVEALKVKNENIASITNLVNAAAKLEALKQKNQQTTMAAGGVYIQAASGSEVGINLANLK